MTTEPESTRDMLNQVLRAAERGFTDALRDATHTLQLALDAGGDVPRVDRLDLTRVLSILVNEALARSELERTITNRRVELNDIGGCLDRIYAIAGLPVFDGSSATEKRARLEQWVRDLRAERDRLLEEDEGNTNSILKIGGLLSRTVDVLKGPPGPLELHSTHDAPEVAAQRMAELELQREVVAAAREYRDYLAGEELVPYGGEVRRARLFMAIAALDTKIAYADACEALGEQRPSPDQDEDHLPDCPLAALDDDAELARLRARDGATDTTTDTRS